MNKIVTSKEEVLRVSRELIQTNGWSAISIRAVASACGVSVGTIYNYFESKSDLIRAAIESVWCDIFHNAQDKEFGDTQSCIQWIYQRMEYGSKEYPGFFSLHSAGFVEIEKSDAANLMKQTWEHILKGLCVVLKKDPNVRPDAFNEELSAEIFSQVLFSLILSALVRQDYDPSPILQIIRRCLY